MKKINILEASGIVGGNHGQCVNSFESNFIGDPQREICNAVKTCTTKSGSVRKTYTAVAVINCKPPGYRA